MAVGRTLGAWTRVAAAGIVGSALRWLSGAAFGQRVGLLLANIVGCVLVGWAVKARQHQGRRDLHGPMGAWFSIGLCGALTSFSAIAVQLATDLDAGDFGLATLWLALTLVGCVAGFQASRRFLGGGLAGEQQ